MNTVERKEQHYVALPEKNRKEKVCCWIKRVFNDDANCSTLIPFPTTVYAKRSYCAIELLCNLPWDEKLLVESFSESWREEMEQRQVVSAAIKVNAFLLSSTSMSSSRMNRTTRLFSCSWVTSLLTINWVGWGNGSKLKFKNNSGGGLRTQKLQWSLERLS